MSTARRIILVAGFSWRHRFTIFSSVFAGLWLFLKPLDTFGVATGLFDSLGIWGYLALLAISILFVILMEIVHKRTQRGRMDFFQLAMLWKTDGSRHVVEAPADIRSANFVDLFLDYIVDTPSGAEWKSRRRAYNWTLILSREGEEAEILPDQTLREGGVRDGSECSLKGTIKPDWDEVHPCC